jgi:hypothetical protein
MADWQAFATAFMEGVATKVDKRKAKADEYEDRQRDLAERNKSVMAKRISIADSAKSYASKLLGMGVSEEVIRTAASAGPTGLTDLMRHMDKAVTTHGPEAVKQNADVFASVDVDPTALLMVGKDALTMDEYINQSFGVVAPSTGSVEDDQGTVFDRMFGRNARERTKARLDSEQTDMGYSIYDINQAAAAAEYQSLAPNAYVNYGTRQTFGMGDKGSEITVLSNILKLQRDSNTDYAALKSKEATLTEKLAKEEALSMPDAEQTRKELGEISKQRRTIEVNLLQPHIDQQMQVYPDGSYAEVMGPSIAALMGVDPTDTPKEPPTSASETLPADPVTTGVETLLGKPTGVPQDDAATVEPPIEPTTPQVVRDITSPSILGGTPLSVVSGPDGRELVRIDRTIKSGDVTIPAGTVLTEEESVDIMYRSKLDTDVGEVTKALVDSSGLDVAELAATYDLTPDASPEAILRALAAWSNENRKVLPFGQDELVAIIRYNLVNNPNVKPSAPAPKAQTKEAPAVPTEYTVPLYSSVDKGDKALKDAEAWLSGK